MQRFRLLVLGIALCICPTASAQLITVYDKTSQLPIADVSVWGNTTSQPFLTNNKGQVMLDDLANNDSLTFHHVGYYTVRLSIAEATRSSIGLVEKSYDLEEVVVSSSKFEERKKDVAQPIQVLHAKDLQFMNQQTAADVVTQTGNIVVQKSQMGGGSPIIRGFEANKVLLVMDGVRMNNAIYRAGHLQNILTVDNNLLDKVEVVYGPGSVVYGSDALGGVVHFYSKQALLADSGSSNLVKANAFMRYSSANHEKTGHVDFNIGFKKLAFLSSFTASDFDDLRAGSNLNPFYGDWGKRQRYVSRIGNKDSIVTNPDTELQKISAYRQYDFLQKVVFQPTKSIRHLLNFQYSTTSDIPRYDRLNEMTAKGIPKSSEWYYGPQQRLFGSYTLGADKLGKVADKGRLILAVQDIVESRHNRNFNSNTLNHRNEQVKVYSLNADVSKILGKHELRYGIEGIHQQITSTANKQNIVTGETAPLDTRYPDGGSTVNSLAGYLTHTWELHPKWVLNDGLRYSYHQLTAKFNDKTFFPLPYNKVELNYGAWNGNVGLVFLPGYDWKFSALASSGFRSPNLDDIGKVFEQSGSDRVMVPNPNLRPEYTYNAEVGITKGIFGSTWVQGTAFYTHYKGAITTATAQMDGKDSILYNNRMSKVLALRNMTNAYIRGISFSIHSDITSHLSFNGSLHYTYGRIKTDSIEMPLDHIPPIFGKVGTVIKLKRSKSEAYVLYNGWKRLSEYNLLGEDNAAYASAFGTPAWLTLNFRTSYQVNKYLQLQAAIENILDQHYRVFASGISAPGRNVVFTLRGSF